jgi:hypothetical protein
MRREVLEWRALARRGWGAAGGRQGFRARQTGAGSKIEYEVYDGCKCAISRECTLVCE